jgi:hypothetical protein
MELGQLNIYIEKMATLVYWSLVMGLNVTVLFWADIFSGIPIIIGLIVSFREFLKQQYRQNFYLVATWLCFVIWQYGLAIAELTLERWVKQYSDYFLIFSCLFVCLLMDSVSKEHVDPVKMSITHIIGAIVIFASIRPDAIIIGERDGLPGVMSIYSNGLFKYSGAILILYMGLIILLYCGKIFFESPNNLKKYSRINFIGAIFAAVITPLGFLLNINDVIPGFTNLIMAIGLLLIAIAFAKEPKIGYVLPFKALRLTVISTISGLSLYTHDFTKNNMFIDNVLFSGMMQGISGILTESLRKGNVNEIILDDAHLLVDRSPNAKDIAFILIVTKSTIGLRNALEKFTEHFIQQYAALYNKEICDISKFDGAKKIVDQCFPFVPEYE